MSRLKCAWCGRPLDGASVFFIPAFEHDPDSTEYCSARCATARRQELFHRPRHFNERWPRFCADVPPELAAMLMAAQRASLGNDYDGWRQRPTSATRANLVRAGLRLYLDRYAPIPEAAIETTAIDLADLPALARGEE